MTVAHLHTSRRGTKCKHKTWTTEGSSDGGSALLQVFVIRLHEAFAPAALSRASPYHLVRTHPPVRLHVHAPSLAYLPLTPCCPVVRIPALAAFARGPVCIISLRLCLGMVSPAAHPLVPPPVHHACTHRRRHRDGGHKLRSGGQMWPQLCDPFSSLHVLAHVPCHESLSRPAVPAPSHRGLSLLPSNGARLAYNRPLPSGLPLAPGCPHPPCRLSAILPHHLIAAWQRHGMHARPLSPVHTSSHAIVLSRPDILIPRAVTLALHHLAVPQQLRETLTLRDGVHHRAPGCPSAAGCPLSPAYAVLCAVIAHLGRSHPHALRCHTAISLHPSNGARHLHMPSLPPTARPRSYTCIDAAQKKDGEQLGCRKEDHSRTHLVRMLNCRRVARTITPAVSLSCAVLARAHTHPLPYSMCRSSACAGPVLVTCM
ncbi:hypothetical protein EVG20_g11198, partial [Dentipellis fragilis]